MKNFKEQEKLRSYILGDIGNEELPAIEERLIADEVYFQELEMAEETLIQDYVDENLGLAEREKFEKRVLNSEENRARVRFARAFRKSADENPPKKPIFFDALKAFFLSPIPAACTVLIILAISGLLIWKNLSDRSEVLTALNKAYRTERPIESRITDFDYAPTKNTRGNEAEKTDKTQLDLAKTLALRGVAENPSAENLHALGRVYLTEKEFDKAIEQFERAVKLAPNNAKLRNDLGVALMEKAKTQDEGKLENLAKANEEFAKAIELDKSLLDTYFNQALCLQTMPGSPQAKEAWQKYLQLDSDSKWADEARKNLETLETDKPVSKTKEQILHEFLEAKQSGERERAWQTLSKNREIPDKLIPQQLTFLFVDGKANGDEAKANEALEALIYAGKLEEEESGDLYWRDLAAYYKKVSEDKIPVLKQAQDYVREGYELRASRKLEKSSQSLKNAVRLFAKAGNNLETKICDFFIINHLFHLNKIEESNKLYLEMAESSRSPHYKWIATQAYVRLAYATGAENRISKSIEYADSALELANETEDLYNLQRIFSILADRYRYIGRFDLSIKFSERSLNIALLPEASKRQKWTDYDVITQILFAQHFYKTADSYQKEALLLSRDIKEKYFEQVSNFYLGMICSADGRNDNAESYFNESIDIAKTFEDEEIRIKNLALAKLKYADFKRSLGKHEEAIAIYQEVNEFHSESEFQREKFACQKGQLLSYIQLKDENAIEKELSAILDMFKKYRKEILEEQNRNVFFDQKHDVYDLAVDYEFDKSDYEKAFSYTEESRARSLLDLINSDKTDPATDSQLLKLPDIQAQIPERVQLLQYSVLQDKVIIWLITKESFQTKYAEIGIEELKEAVFSYLNLLNYHEVSNAQKESELSEKLYKILVSPIEEKLDTQKEICLIPDKFLFHLPFASLVSPENQRYLISDYNIFYAPSANVFLASTREAQERKNNSVETLLSIGNPAFSQKNYPDLPKLPSAEKEVSEINEFYSKPIRLIGLEATKREVKQNFTKSSVIHFAGHYSVNEQIPSLSGLVLAEKEKLGEKENSLLTNYEILGTNLLQTRLIVLSACKTGVEGFYQGEGIIGASRTFLAGKVPLVVASQWAVDSEATKELMIEFHRYRKVEKLPTVAALRKAQLAILNAQDKKFRHPYFWAAFMTLGGYAEF